MEPIIAPVTALIPQPVGILRLSGDGLEDRLRFLFPDLSLPLVHRSVTRVVPTVDGESLDECLLLFFRAPHSLTGEDVVELHAHGNPHNMRRLLTLFHQQGIRLAKPGEFSLRAYQNKKISLLKAESLHRMISAPSYSDFQAAHRAYSNERLHPLADVQERYLDILAYFFTFLDHPDEAEVDQTDLTVSALSSRLKELDGLLRVHLTRYRKQSRPYNGFSVLLAGAPNSGKSSLFNRILKDNRAIVSPSPGTTRDLLEGRLSFPFGDIILLDSAGLRSSDDWIEQEGVRKTRQSFSRVDCLLWIASPDHPNPPAFVQQSRPGQRRFFVWNKSDLSLPPSSFFFDHVVSARTRKGLSSILNRLSSLAEEFYQSPETPLSTIESDRQRDLLRALRRITHHVLSNTHAQHFDLALSSLEEGKKLLDDGIGAVPTSDLYDRVFKLFCLGK